VPEISRFLGIRIYMYFEEHSPPHFHARYAGKEILVEIASFAIMRGDFPGRALGLVVEWARLHRGELEANWIRARSTEPLVPIEPLG
jgi:hypothetical protein